jgi:FMN-dependent NADH-azoreductase
MKLLHIDSSALGQHSVTRELTAATVASYRERETGADVTYRDLAAEPLTHWSPVGGDPAAMSPEQQVEAAINEEVLQEFLAADVVVIGAPMYNFGVPSSLKAWIDRIAVAGRTFRYTANGPEGLAGPKKVLIASARGGFYAGTANAASDFQEAYLRQVFGFIGVSDVEFVRAEGIGFGPEQRAASIAAAHTAIKAQPLALAA